MADVTGHHYAIEFPKFFNLIKLIGAQRP